MTPKTQKRPDGNPDVSKTSPLKNLIDVDGNSLMSRPALTLPARLEALEARLTARLDAIDNRLDRQVQP